MTHVTRLQWEKVASVRTGGKPFFYVAFPVMNGHKRKYSVHWDRNARQWEASFDDFETMLIPESHGHFSSSKEAQATAQADYNLYATKGA